MTSRELETEPNEHDQKTASHLRRDKWSIVIHWELFCITPLLKPPRCCLVSQIAFPKNSISFEQL